MAKIVVNIKYDNCVWRIVERADSPNSPYYVIEKKGKDAMGQVTFIETLKIFPPCRGEIIGKDPSAFLHIVLKKISNDIEIYKKD